MITRFGLALPALLLFAHVGAPGYGGAGFPEFAASPALPASPPAPAKADSTGTRLYVPNQDGASISVLDGGGRLLETVDLRAFGFSARAMPHQVAVAPDGSAWYVTLVGDGVVARFDRDGRLVATAEVELPGMIVLDAARDRLYVSRALRAVDPPRRLAVLRASDLEPIEEPEIFVPRPHALAVDTVSGRVYTGSLSTNELVSYDPGTGRARVVRVDGAPNGFVGLATSPDGRRLVATTQVTDRLLAFDATAADGPVEIASVPVAAGPYDVAYSPDGESVWFPNQRADAVTRVDARDWTVRTVVRDDRFAEPHGVAITADGATVYITNHYGAPGEDRTAPRRARRAEDDADAARTDRAGGTVAVIDARTAEVRTVTEVGPFAAAPGLVEPTTALPDSSRPDATGEGPAGESP